ncbi:MAG TPA: M23 family metallopeptidase [Galbitalea sp.]|jgi:hypothetical protein
MILIVNPFAGCPVGWTWAQHVAAINPSTGKHYAGGTDYIMYPPKKITAAADGVVTLVAGQNGFTPGKAIVLKLADGRSINYREVASTLVKSGTKVKRGQAIGMPNKASRWPHIDATVDGVRVEFEPLVNSLATASGGSTPLNNLEGNPMPSLFHNLDSKPLRYALAGGSPGTPANWLETTDKGLATALSAQIGAASAGLNDASFKAWKAAYLASVATTGDDTALLAAMKANTTVLTEVLAATKALNPPG